MNFNYPYLIDGRGQTATAGYALHIRQLIEQVLFTARGERVNRPDFGSGLMQLVFAPGSREVIAATQFQVQGALQQVLDELIQIDTVTVNIEDAQLSVQVNYRLHQTGEPGVAAFVRGLPL
jgi:phage baseplate assembly protein W